MSGKSNVLIFGGLDVITPVIVSHLLSSDVEPLVNYIRIVDKYIVRPPTTWIPKSFKEALVNRKDVLEYRQGNLANPDVIAAAFMPPVDGSPFTHVIDLTGETYFSRSEDLQISRTLNISVSIATAASQRNIKAYVRVLPPFYDHKGGNREKRKEGFKEDEEAGWKPLGSRGIWWHEMVRAIGAIPDLPLVVLRIGLAYGPNFLGFEITPVILLGLVYKKIDQEMKLLWSPKLRKNTIHTLDLAAIIWKAAEWVAREGRQAANAAAGVPLPPTNHLLVSQTPGTAPSSPVTVPVFNVVDQGDTTQETLLSSVAHTFSIPFGFHGKLEFSGVTIGDNFDTPLTGELGIGQIHEVSEDANELHLREWAEIIVHSNPPVANTPLSPYLPAYLFEEHGCALNGTKVQEVLGHTYRYPRLDEKAIRDFIEWCREEEIWPESPLYTGH